MSTKILAFSGSSRSGSLNQMLLDVAVSGARDAGAVVTSIKLADYQLPIFDADLEAAEGVPTAARELQALVASHDTLLIATPEYNGGYTALLKNTLDWISRPPLAAYSALFAGKLAAVVSASPGPLGGMRSQIALKLVLDKWDPLESTCRHASLSIL